jgi:hypothetical protein
VDKETDEVLSLFSHLSPLTCKNIGKYYYVSDFSKGLARVIKDGKIGLIDTTGKEIVPCEYDRVDEFLKEFACVKKYGKWGFIDKKGKAVIPCKYDDVDNFSKGLARVKKNGKYGLVDKTGKEVLPCKFDSLSYSMQDGEMVIIVEDRKARYLLTLPKNFAQIAEEASETEETLEDNQKKELKAMYTELQDENFPTENLPDNEKK